MKKNMERGHTYVQVVLSIYIKAGILLKKWTRLHGQYIFFQPNDPSHIISYIPRVACQNDINIYKMYYNCIFVLSINPALFLL